MLVATTIYLLDSDIRHGNSACSQSWCSPTFLVVPISKQCWSFRLYTHTYDLLLVMQLYLYPDSSWCTMNCSSGLLISPATNVLRRVAGGTEVEVQQQRCWTCYDILTNPGIKRYTSYLEKGKTRLGIRCNYHFPKYQLPPVHFSLQHVIWLEVRVILKLAHRILHEAFEPQCSWRVGPICDHLCSMRSLDPMFRRLDVSIWEWQLEGIIAIPQLSCKRNRPIKFLMQW